MSEATPYVFYCDRPDCSEVLVTRNEDDVSAYIQLADAGWGATERRASLGFIRRHYCPAHK